ncbi:ribbon-helix-helix protein, CopG family [Frankia sp. Cas4]|uniref:ribbon-helix-helix protein, CopG family n=1 Tax=Frankia sp. Cas4 TaxID=3073927 RepID=UPI002AD2D1EF|nr:ribbon-helix-helix protein, CopG family [Frankia sp. Cas4]
MSKVSAEVRLDATVLECLDAAARRLGRSRDELIEDSVRRDLAAQILSGVFVRIRRNSELTDEEAETVAYEELDAARVGENGTPSLSPR